MAELTDNEVLSILNKMDAEQKFFEQMTAARQHARAVITHYQQARAGLAGLAGEQARLEEALVRLRPMVGVLDAEVTAKQNAVAKLATQVEQAEAKAAAAETKRSRATADLDAKIRATETAFETARGLADAEEGRLASLRTQVDRLEAQIRDLKTERAALAAAATTSPT